jgi:hypothetical protein
VLGTQLLRGNHRPVKHRSRRAFLTHARTMTEKTSAGVSRPLGAWSAFARAAQAPLKVVMWFDEAGTVSALGVTARCVPLSYSLDTPWQESHRNARAPAPRVARTRCWLTVAVSGESGVTHYLTEPAIAPRE